MTTNSLRNSAPPQVRRGFFGYVSVVVGAAVLAVTLTAIFTPMTWTADFAYVAPAVWLMALLAIVVELRPTLAPGSRYSQTALLSLSFTIAVLVAWGFLPALIVQTVVAAWSFTALGATVWRTAFNAAQFAIALVAAHLVLLSFGPVETAPWITSAGDIAAILLAGIAWFAVSHVLVATAWALRFDMPWWRVCWRSLAYEGVVHAALLALAPILVAAASVSAWLVLLAGVPIYGVYRMARMSAEREHLSLSDPLTGLANRKGFQQVVEENLARCAESGGGLAVAVCDLDRFAAVNNSLGHDVGDRLLVELARRFSRHTGNERAVAARIGADEFAFLLPEIKDEEDARTQALRVQAALGEPVWLDDISVDLSGSIGFACHPQHGSDFDSLFRHANIATSEAKKRGSSISMYAPEFDHHSVQGLALLGDLRRALDSPDMPGVHLYYQPQVEVATGTVVSVEALLRYRHPVQGNVQPSEVIALAEHSAVMRILTYRVIDEAVSQLAAWRHSGLDLRMAVNVSVRDLHAPDFCDYLTDRLQHHDVAPHSLELEITESALMADPRRVVATLTRLEALGVGLSLDDFGTGYSSMQHLRGLQVNEVKIDKSFVQSMWEDSDSAAIVRSIIELGRALGLRVVAEGVENEHTWRQLANLGCDVAQGWFHARPMPAHDVAGWLARYQPPRQLRAVRAASAATAAST